MSEGAYAKGVIPGQKTVTISYVRVGCARNDDSRALRALDDEKVCLHV